MAIFLEGVALKHLFSGSHTVQRICLSGKHLQNRVRGLELTTRAQKTLFLARRWHFQAILGQKWPFFLRGGGGGLIHPFLGSHMLGHKFLF